MWAYRSERVGMVPERFSGAPVTLRLLGEHQVHNALAAAAAAHALDIDTSAIAAALSAAEPHSPGRPQVLQRPDGITIINDAFNANPESTAAGLRSLTCYAGPRRTIAVLGEMRELGPAAETAHRDTGHLAADLGIDILVTVGHGLMGTLADTAAPGPPRLPFTPPKTRTSCCRCCAACSGPAMLSSSRHPARSAWRTSRRHSKRMVRPALPANRRRPMASRSAQGAADRLSADAKVCRPVDHIG